MVLLEGGPAVNDKAETTTSEQPRRGHDDNESNLLAHREYLRKAEMVISVSVADKDHLDVP